jgi:hydrogenase expression/formation protein HypC
MCLGIPMRVESAAGGVATCAGRGGSRRIATLLVGDCAPGDWLLTFLDDARERISAERATEIDAVLDLLEMAMGGGGKGAAAPFVLPSSLGPYAGGADLSEPSNERAI